jgi:hypothetical protein
VIEPPFTVDVAAEEADTAGVKISGAAPTVGREVNGAVVGNSLMDET